MATVGSPAHPLLQHFPETCVLDESRKAFLQEQASTLNDLTAGRLNRANRFRRLLLGAKGIGKTTFLKALLVAAEAAYGETLLTAYVSYSETRLRLAAVILRRLQQLNLIPSLDDFILEERLQLSDRARAIIAAQQLEVPDLVVASAKDLRELGFPAGAAAKIEADLGTTPLFTRIGKWLELNGKFLFFVVDEFQTVYCDACASGPLTISDAHALGDNADGRIHCILSGSSTHLRRLAFATVSPDSDIAKSHPHYRCIDLNGTKFQARWIYPFLEETAFKALYAALSESQESQEIESLTDENIAFLLLHSGGSPGALAELLSGRAISHFHLSTKGINLTEPLMDPRAQVLDSLFKSQTNQGRSAGSQCPSAMNVFRAAILVPRAHVEGDETLLYDMADAGLIRYIAESFDKKLVGFGNPLIYFECLSRGSPTISALELATLCSPTGKKLGDLAEETARRLFCNGFIADPQSPDAVLPSNRVTYAPNPSQLVIAQPPTSRRLCPLHVL
jgi:energy-coupling factor transporter ATP-binding protein EcfA2